MLLVRLLGCLACQCLSEDELIMGLVFITGALQSNSYVIIIMHGHSLFFFSRRVGWILKDDYCYHMTLSSGGMWNLLGRSGGLLSLMISSIWVRLKPLFQMKRLSRWIRLTQFNYWFNQCANCFTLRCSQHCWLNICFPANRLELCNCEKMGFISFSCSIGLDCSFQGHNSVYYLVQIRAWFKQLFMVWMITESHFIYFISSYTWHISW